jgi:SSS family solute:Na+ symporter
VEIAVFLFLFALITAVGLLAGRWRAGDLSQLDEWALGGRRFGSFVTWFLQGGSIYTTYAFIAIPALVYGSGAIGFFALAYLIVAYPVAFVCLPPLWRVAHERGHVTVSDFVKERFSSTTLATLVALTGLVATLPYLALQVYGIQVSIAELGVPVEVSLTLAFVILAGITYVSGLRSAALIAIVKDVLIWITVLVAVIYIPIRLGGYSHVFAQVGPAKRNLRPSDFAGYSTLALGSGLALFLYPHTITGSLSSSSDGVIERNCVFLPLYTIMLGLLAILGYMAIAAGVHPTAAYGDNSVIPALFQKMFPPAFAGFALAAISIGALVPASIMAIAAGNLFSRNIYRELVTHPPSPAKETRISKLASLTVKIGAVAFILAVPSTYVVNFQLAGGVWILQTLPAAFLALFCPWLDRRATIAGCVAGMTLGSYLLVDTSFQSSTYAFDLLGVRARLFIGLVALGVNLAVVLIGSALSSLGSGRRRQRLATQGPAASPTSAPAETVPLH